MTTSTRHPNQPRSGVFISYARSDGKALASRLRQQLEAQGFEVWQDLTEMESGKWWLQITEALNHVEFMALVITPNALKSDIVRKEWRYARQQGVCVYPIKGAPDLDFKSMPRWMREQHFYDLSDKLGGEKFVSNLKRSCETPRVPFMVDDLPDDFVPRDEEFEQIIGLLLDEQREEPVAITAALRGAGGYGKTTLARAVCHDERIQDAFDDGVLWVTLGETPGELLGKVEDLIEMLSGQRPGFTNLEAAITRLKELLEDRDLLLVIDDVWQSAHLRPFTQGGKRCARLITTRNLDVLPGGAHKVKVDAMKQHEAVALLSAGFEGAPGLAVAAGELGRLAARLGEWPLLLKLANGYVRRSVEHESRPLPAAVARAHQALDRRGLTYFDVRDSQQRNDAVAKTIGISLELLTEAERARYFELAIFPEDVEIPAATLEKFWTRTGGLDDFETDDLCTRLNRLSLLLGYDATKRRLQLHDVVRSYLLEQQKDALPQLHQQLLDAHQPSPTPAPYPSPTPHWSALPDDEPYLWDHLAFHLLAAGRGEELVTTVKDWRYLAKKILLRKAHAVEHDLLKAIAVAPADDPLATLQRGIAGSSHLLNHCTTRREVEETLHLRLQHLQGLRAMLQEMLQCLERPLITPQADLPDQPHPALIRTLEGHANSVLGCAFSPDGKLIVSASYDGTLKVWEAQSGALLRSFDGHSSNVNGCVFSPDSKLIVSASWDKTLKIWDAQSGALLRSLEGHFDSVEGCAFSPDGKLIVSASWDKTLKVWETQSGTLLRSLEGHFDPVEGCAFSPDGKLIVSGSWGAGATLKVWETQSGALLRSLEGHSSGVNSCAFSPDSKLIVSASNDDTLKVWETQSGALLRSLEGHAKSVLGCAFSPDGKLIVSASSDCTLKVWEALLGMLLYSLDGHLDQVNACAFSPDGKLIVSASSDCTLKVWEALSGMLLRSPDGHSSSVTGCAFSPDGKLIVSASYDGTLKVWETQSGALPRSLNGHADSVAGCAFSPDGKLIVSASYDTTLKIWDAQSGALLRSLNEHADLVTGCAFSPDGKLIVSASYDTTLKIWDAQSGALLRSLKGHSSWVNSCAFSPDGKLIVSASTDNTLKVWETQSGALLRSLNGHAGSVIGCAFSPDGKLIVSASGKTLKVCETQSGTLLRSLEGHYNRVVGCAFSPDGKLIISVSHDKTLKIWEAASGKCLATLFADGFMSCCAVHGDLIVAGGERGLYFLRLVQ